MNHMVLRKELKHGGENVEESYSVEKLLPILRNIHPVRCNAAVCTCHKELQGRTN